MPKSGKNKGQRFAWSDIDTKYVDKLAAEIIGKIPDEATKKKNEARFKNLMPELLKKKAAPKPPTKKAAPEKAMAKKTATAKAKK